MELPEKIRVAVVEDDMIHYKLILQHLDPETFTVEWFQTAISFLDHKEEGFDIVTLDHNLPDARGLDILKAMKSGGLENHVIYFSGQDDVSVVVEVYRLGARHYIVKNQNAFVEFRHAVDQIVKEIGLRNELQQLKGLVVRREKYERLVGESPEMMRVLKLIQKVERTDLLTLITGESGTGKELVAQAIHKNSNRSKKPFVAVNVSAIPSDLVESELFGHEKGAFTGADSRRFGKFEEADQGTIFLDEIGDMDLMLQTKLLRVLQEKTITRLGSNKELPVDIRILLATNRNLGKMVREGRFREDLYYRVQGFLIHLPPLRDRGNDVIILAEHFLKAYYAEATQVPKVFHRSAWERLLRHPWPGNVRELKAVVERAILISDGPEILGEDLMFSE